VRTVCGALLLTTSVLALLACSNGLTQSSATEAIRAELATTSADVAKVEVISDSIVRATITGRQMLLRFRRYNGEWVWNAADTGTGSWVAVSEVVTQVRETARHHKAMQWATDHHDDYMSTVKLLDHYTDSLPRQLNSSFDDIGSASEEQPQRDAWGSEILASFHASERTVTFVSNGPDKTRETSDDVVLRVASETTWDDVGKQPIYKYSKQWTVPEGLEPATRAAAGTDTVEIQPSRVVTK
jgi:hypothetical protein